MWYINFLIVWVRYLVTSFSNMWVVPHLSKEDYLWEKIIFWEFVAEYTLRPAKIEAAYNGIQTSSLERRGIYCNPINFNWDLYQNLLSKFYFTSLMKNCCKRALEIFQIKRFLNSWLECNIKKKKIELLAFERVIWRNFTILTEGIHYIYNC